MRATDDMVRALMHKAEHLDMLNVSEQRAKALLIAALSARHTHADRDLDRIHDHGGHYHAD